MTESIWPTVSRTTRQSFAMARRFGSRLSDRAHGYRVGTFRDFYSTETARPDPSVASDFEQIFFDHNGPLVHKWKHYLPAYSNHLAPYRQGFGRAVEQGRGLRILEIGVSQGGSLAMWRSYFGPDAVIYGIDIDERCADVGDENGIVRIGSQADTAFLSDVVREMGGIDVVIDDGSHHNEHLTATFRHLFPLLSEGGLYIAEDLHTSYWSNYRGGYRRPGAFLELVKDLIDDVHSWYHEKGKRVPEVADMVGNISVYDSIVFIYKESIRRPTNIKTGTAQFS